MKDGKFETQAEIYQALLQNKKLCSDNFSDGVYVEMRDGLQVSQYGNQAYQSFSNPHQWSIYQEQKRKVKIVAHVHNEGAICFSSEGSRDCKDCDSDRNYKRLSLSFDADVM